MVSQRTQRSRKGRKEMLGANVASFAAPLRSLRYSIEI